ncbi:MAG: sugar phosphate nucleotidyltransferase [Chitinispirillaceae bacterium]|nr:sugar phosphate nucleotidyltransferase [Chitinispirillaceae bacterium]
MIEETFARAGVLTKDRPLVITGARIALQMAALVPKKWTFDTIVEPVGKNTAPALALAAAWIEARYGESIMVVLPADHLVSPARAFNQAMRYACGIAEKRNELVVFGVKPTRPETGYGYIQLGRKNGTKGSAASFSVSRFIEKPDLTKAKKLCLSASYRWNSGMFVWKTGVLLEEVRTHMPELFVQVQRASTAKFSRKAIARFYRDAAKESIDVGVMEKSSRVGAVVGAFTWDDIGAWEALCRVHGVNHAGTTIVGERLFERECSGSIVVNKSSRTVAAVGCANLGVFVTDDAVLVIDRSKLPEIKTYLGEMKKDSSIPKQLF